MGLEKLAEIPSGYLQIFFGLVLLVSVFFPALRLTCRILRILPQRKLWKKLEPRIFELTQSDVGGLPDPTCYVFSSVLTERPGLANLQAVPLALEHLAIEIESPIRSLRSLSYLSVLIGLLSTVVLLTLCFQKGGQINPELLKNVYAVNALAVTIAVAIFICFHWSRRRADEFLLTASRVMGKLNMESPASGVDPNLVRALDAVAEKFKDWGQEVSKTHLRQIQGLMKEVQGLGEAIREMVKDLITARQEEERGILPVLRLLEQRTEMMSQRLDHGFNRLAQPFLQGLPVIEKLDKNTETLGNTVNQLLEADIKGVLEELTRVTREILAAALSELTGVVLEMNRAVADLPNTVRISLDGVSQEISNGTVRAMRTSIKETVEPKITEFANILQGFSAAIQALHRTIDALPQVIHNGLGGVAETISIAASQTIRQSLESTEASMEEIKVALTKLANGSDNLKKTIESFAVMIRQESKSLGESIPAATRQEIRRVMEETINADKQEMQRLIGELNKAIEIIGTNLSGIPTNIREELQNFNKDIKTLYPQVRQLLEVSSQQILSEVRKGADGNIVNKLQGISDTLNRIDLNLKQLGIKMGEAERSKITASTEEKPPIVKEEVLYEGIAEELGDSPNPRAAEAEGQPYEIKGPTQMDSPPKEKRPTSFWERWRKR